MNHTPSHRCSQCNSPLVLISTVTKVLEGSRFPQTTTIYRCSNQECQERKDKETAKRVQLQQEREEANKKRAEDKLQKKKMAKEVTH